MAPRRRPLPAAAAERAGVAGRLEARAGRYRVEREAWAWWKAEETWMRAPRRPDGRRRPSRGQLSLVPDDGTHAYGPHPRRPDGRLDYVAARRIIIEEREGTAVRPYERHAGGDLRSGTVVDASAANVDAEGEWIDPGYCAHGMTVGVRCRYCGGSAVKQLDSREARRIVQEERGGTAHRPSTFMRTEPVDTIEGRLHNLLGALRIA